MPEIDYREADGDPRTLAHRTLETLVGQDRPPLGQLSPQDWMTDARTQAIVRALTAGGAEIRYVGGCVRDTLLHRPIQDIDIATQETPNVVIQRLEDAGLKAVPTGIKHGTVTAIVDGLSVEVTTLRRDVKTDGRHAEVAFTTDFREDAARRDFTINALSATPDGAVYDYFDGLSDLAARGSCASLDARTNESRKTTCASCGSSVFTPTMAEARRTPKPSPPAAPMLTD